MSNEDTNTSTNTNGEHKPRASNEGWVRISVERHKGRIRYVVKGMVGDREVGWCVVATRATLREIAAMLATQIAERVDLTGAGDRHE